ncbi:MBL fold metallo-hydrolase [Listeria sp. FSL L7-1509]|uniref:MBL fold metallo-hydrolase n=1 Tax=Listeria immobilis TaxID=2713502 RepID=A0ABR6SW51_9LIST|nr:MBL fold metallo-hydrolase [Listeria immobilis]MBC1482651.1 MBL fold metallo-hydrolase [Listeria immobilis]MBC1507175.1 MBL fold metallo-hydrolase [Listeria immobilis]MBC1509913.1 MBL fold metallo-hydrolase [Listeria immobilis]MBC6302549.1 MBL fold metallo-hydrolase [Listeria immobilis]MBC6312817.1 MBL fold metallo-hydrolase [Listeria immobilis]
MTKKKQAIPPNTKFFQQEAFQNETTTVIRWLGNSGVLLNSGTTNILIDPVLEGFDIPLLIDMPIPPEDIPHLDAILITHSDNDHYSLPTLKKLIPVTSSFHGPEYVARLMREQLQIDANGHKIYDTFKINNLTISLTKADHLWQNATTKFEHTFKIEDYCGYWIDTPDGTLWIPGDSRLLQEQLEMTPPDAILFDFSDNEWHIGFANAVKLANTYPQADLILSHWGTVDAPDMNVFNADPADLFDKVINPDRIQLLAAGEPIILTKKTN